LSSTDDQFPQARLLEVDPYFALFNFWSEEATTATCGFALTLVLSLLVNAMV
jgi:hypothetical protein